jgi:hypothetical protein
MTSCCISKLSHRCTIHCCHQVPQRRLDPATPLTCLHGEMQMPRDNCRCCALFLLERALPHARNQPVGASHYASQAHGHWITGNFHDALIQRLLGLQLVREAFHSETIRHHSEGMLV